MSLAIYVCIVHKLTLDGKLRSQSRDLERGITLRLQDGLNIHGILYVTQPLRELLIFYHFKLFQALY